MRLRITDAAPELVAKVGEWASKQKREASLALERAQFGSATKLLGLLACKRGAACERAILQADPRQLFASLVDVRHHSFFLEAGKPVEDDSMPDEAHAAAVAAVTHSRAEAVLAQRLAGVCRTHERSRQ